MVLPYFILTTTLQVGKEMATGPEYPIELHGWRLDQFLHSGSNTTTPYYFPQFLHTLQVLSGLTDRHPNPTPLYLEASCIDYSKYCTIIPRTA